MFQLFSDIGPPRVEKLKVVEKCQKVESRIYMDLIFRCFQGVRVQKVESRFTWTLFFGVFEGQRVKRQHFSASFGVSMTQRGKGVKV